MSPTDRGSLLIAVVVAAVVLTVAGGLYLIGSPAEERRRRMDERRRLDLQRLQLAADRYWTQNSRLAASLEELAQEAATRIDSRDPSTDQAYEYRVKDANAYELCAVFERPSPERFSGFWSHGPGRQCFQVIPREIRP
jgi:hypothetical protein